MIAIDAVVLVVFRFINFGVIIGMGWYLVKKYGLPGIQHAMKEEHAYFEELKHTHHHLKKEQETIEQIIIQNLKEQDRLKERLMRWLASMDDQNKKLLAQKEDYRKKLQDRIAIQQQQVTQHRMAAAVMAEAIIQARHQLEQDANNVAMQHSIIDTALAKMRTQ